MDKLKYDFYNRYSLDVARDLLGKKLVIGNLKVIITETESYRGYDDEASHAFKGPTYRSSIMFGIPGIVYVYMIYGMYYCFNIVTEEKGSPSAVLIRGAIIDDLKLINLNHAKKLSYIINGPGKLCKYLNITKAHNIIDLTQDSNLYLTNFIDIKINDYKATPRIGISKAKDKLWRFVCNDSIVDNIINNIK